MFSGTISNAVKLDIQINGWEQSKGTNSIFSKREQKARANMAPEQKMLENFKEQLENDRKQSENNKIAYKVMKGDTLTPDEEQYLNKHNPGLLSSYRHMKEDEKAYEEELRHCKTKDEVQEFKLNKMASFLSELKSLHGDAQAAKAMEIMQKVNVFRKAEQNFIESGAYSSLPTEADEAIDRAEDRNDKQEVVLEVIDEAKENSEVEFAKDFESAEKNETVHDTSPNKIEKTEKKPQEETNYLKEIETICRKYFKYIIYTFN